MHFGLVLLGKRVIFRVFGLVNSIHSGKAGPPSAHCPLAVRKPHLLSQHVAEGMTFPLSSSGVQGGSPGQSHSPTGALQPQGATLGAERHGRSRW